MNEYVYSVLEELRKKFRCKLNPYDKNPSLSMTLHWMYSKNSVAGSFQESTPIVLGNNARTTYRTEYNTSRKFKEQRDVPGVRTESDVLAILDKVMVQAKAENVAEEDNTRLMQLLTPFLGGHAAWITERWYDWALCIIHGGLHHEYRGMGLSLRRSEAINKWKNENKKENEEDNRQDFGGAVGGDV